MLRRTHTTDIQELPLYGGQVLDPLDPDQIPPRRAFLDGYDELFFSGGQLSCYHGDEFFPGFFQILAGCLFSGHALKFGFKDGTDISEPRIKNLYHGPVMADQVNDKRLPHGNAEVPIFEQHHDIEEVPRVLAIQGGADFSRIQFIFCEHLAFHGNLKEIHDPRRENPSCRRKYGTAYDQVRLDLDHRLLSPYEQSAGQIASSGLLRNDFRSGNCALDGPAYTGKGIACLTQGDIPFPNGEVHEVDINGDARKIPDEKIDSRPSLEGKGGFSVDQRNDPQEQFGLSEKYGIDHAGIPSRSAGTVIRYLASYRPCGTIIRFPFPRSTFETSSFDTQG